MDSHDSHTDRNKHMEGIVALASHQNTILWWIKNTVLAKISYILSLVGISFFEKMSYNSES